MKDGFIRHQNKARSACIKKSFCEREIGAFHLTKISGLNYQKFCMLIGMVHIFHQARPILLYMLGHISGQDLFHKMLKDNEVAILSAGSCLI